MSDTYTPTHACPACKATDHLVIDVTTTARLTPAGTMVDPHADYDDDSMTRCSACDHQGPLRMFHLSDPPVAAPATELNAHSLLAREILLTLGGLLASDGPIQAAARQQHPCVVAAHNLLGKLCFAGSYRPLTDADRAPPFSTIEGETALCIWEWLDANSGDTGHHPFLRKFRSTYGTCELRHVALALARYCDQVYEALPLAARDCRPFDWEIIPAILNTVIFATEVYVPNNPALAADLVGSRLLQDDNQEDAA